VIHSSIGRCAGDFRFPNPELANSSDYERRNVRQHRIERSLQRLGTAPDLRQKQGALKRGQCGGGELAGMGARRQLAPVLPSSTRK
jgi:hypothetical protein